MPAGPVTSLRLFDTARGAVVPVEWREPGRASIYVCGPTVQDVPHLGHGRMALVFDVLRRYLVFAGIDVHFVSNITDVDDKIIARAAAEGRREPEVAARYEAVWWQAMDALGVDRPTDSPHATGWVTQMVAVVSALLERGVAYQTPSGVYLSVEAVDGYGLLARQSLDSLRAGARVEADEDKRSPLDFALWKAARPGEPAWPAPFGEGRPGWHTECVAMSLGLLGEDFDLHGGGIDLAFPHHENERAQAVALGRRFARHWVHNGFVVVDGEKMSKSVGNFTTLTDLLDRADPRAYRLLVLRSHYRRPIDVTPESVAGAEGGLERLDTLAQRFGLAPDAAAPTAAGALEAGADPEAVERFMAAMDDDLDTPGALSGLYDLVRRAHAEADAGRQAEGRRLAATVAALAAALGLRLAAATVSVPAEVAARAAERDQARAGRDWARADAIRDELAAAGWVVEDGPDGTRLHR